MLTAANFSEGLINAIKIGGDTDTNGAIAAVLLGTSIFRPGSAACEANKITFT